MGRKKKAAVTTARPGPDPPPAPAGGTSTRRAGREAAVAAASVCATLAAVLVVMNATLLLETFSNVMCIFQALSVFAPYLSVGTDVAVLLIFISFAVALMLAVRSMMPDVFRSVGQFARQATRASESQVLSNADVLPTSSLPASSQRCTNEAIEGESLARRDRQALKRDRRRWCQCRDARPVLADEDSLEVAFAEVFFELPEHLFDEEIKPMLLRDLLYKPFCRDCGKRIECLPFPIFELREGECDCDDPLPCIRRPKTRLEVDGGRLIVRYLMETPSDNDELNFKTMKEIVLSNECLMCCKLIKQDRPVFDEDDDDDDDEYFDEFRLETFSFTGDEKTDEKFAMLANAGIEPVEGYFEARDWAC